MLQALRFKLMTMIDQYYMLTRYYEPFNKRTRAKRDVAIRRKMREIA